MILEFAGEGYNFEDVIVVVIGPDEPLDSADWSLCQLGRLCQGQVAVPHTSCAVRTLVTCSDIPLPLERLADIERV